MMVVCPRHIPAQERRTEPLLPVLLGEAGGFVHFHLQGFRKPGLCRQNIPLKLKSCIPRFIQSTAKISNPAIFQTSSQPV